MNILKCAQCGHENDTTRVFCQNCGSRLERSAGVSVPAVEEPGRPAAAPTAPVAKKRVIPRPSSGVKQKSLAGLFVRKLISTAILAAILAAVILMARPPDEVPPPAPANIVAADNLASFLHESSKSIYPRAVELSQDQVNSYLASKVTADSSQGGAVLRPQLKRVFVVIRSGSLRVFIDQTIRGYSVYQYLDLVPTQTSSGVVMTVAGGGIGRLPMPKQGLFLLEGAFSSLSNALADVHSVFANAKEITLSPGKANIRWAGKTTAP